MSCFFLSIRKRDNGVMRVHWTIYSVNSLVIMDQMLSLSKKTKLSPED
jgi:hypothetical protein